MTDIIEVAKKIESDRTTASHNVNATSSRTHAFIELKMYRKKGNDVHINHIKFIDLAGSERFEKAGHKHSKVEAIMG